MSNQFALIDNNLKQQLQLAQKKINNVLDIQQLYLLKSEFLGKKSYISSVLKMINNLDNETKVTIGALINNVKHEINNAITKKILILEEQLVLDTLKKDKIDVSLPPVNFTFGKINPLYLVIKQITKIFESLGYQIVSGTEIEDEEFNFNRLNLPKSHPARAMQDTFYLKNLDANNSPLLLRTHCTNVTARILSTISNKIEHPLAFVSIGNVYRKDNDDATHSHQFSQIDAFLIGDNINFAKLKWTLEYFCKELFGSNTKIRLRPSYFPFTEPSAEVDVSCPICETKGCGLCKKTGWIEILGAGMIHPEVFAACGLNGTSLTGFAFGAGLERIAMIKYSIDDIRHFYTNDLRFLKQF